MCMYYVWELERLVEWRYSKLTFLCKSHKAIKSLELLSLSARAVGGSDATDERVLGNGGETLWYLSHRTTTRQ